MKRQVNLMTDAARFRMALRLHLRHWALATGIVSITLIPIGAFRWDEACHARQEHQAMEAGYEPIRRLVKLNRELRAEAGKLVKDERLELELSYSRPVSALLSIITAVAQESQGQLYVEHLRVSPKLPLGGTTASLTIASGEQKMVIEAAATLTYDVARHVEGLQKAPIKAVKVTSDVVVTQDDKDHKKYVVECSF